MENDEEWEAFKLKLTLAEAELKCRIVELAEDGFTTSKEQVGFITALAFGLASSAVESSVEATEGGDRTVGSMTLAIYGDTLQGPMMKLVQAMNGKRE